MTEFTDKTDRLKLTMDEIASSISSITQAIDEGAHGVNGAAQSTQLLVRDMELTDTPYRASGWRKRELHDMARQISSYGPSKVVVTGNLHLHRL